MTELIDKLTRKVYEEGVQKGKSEADVIIAHAREEEKNIITMAQQKAHVIITEAQKKADEFKKSTDADIRMSAQKSMAFLRQRIEEMITLSLAEDAAEKGLSDKDFVKNMFETIVGSWDASDYSNETLVAKLPEKEVQEFEKYFHNKMKQKMKSPAVFEPDQKIKAGFTVEPSNGKVRIGFTDNDFKELISFFLRPKVRAYLFEDDKKA